MPRKPVQTHEDLRKNGSAGTSRWDVMAPLGNRGTASWLDAKTELLKETIAAATEAGAGLLFSKTSDGGALTLYVLTEGRTHKLYPASADEVNQALQQVFMIASS